MDNPMCERCAFYLEHNLMHEAMCEWVGINREQAMEDINYLQGVHDFAQKVVEKMESGKCMSE